MKSRAIIEIVIVSFLERLQTYYKNKDFSIQANTCLHAAVQLKLVILHKFINNLLH